MDPTTLPDLVTLHVLLEERQVTRAARRLGITQSSMSHRLARLREQLDDPLFVRDGSRLLPTPRALQLAGPLAEGFSVLRAAMAPEAFDPLRARFGLDLHLPDLLVVVAPRLVAAFARDAPGVTLRLRPIPADPAARLAEDDRSLALLPAHFLDDTLRSRSVGEGRFEVVGRADHPALRAPLTVEGWLSFPHVVVRTGNERANVLDERLVALGLERRIGLEVPSFVVGLLALTGSDLLMNAPVPLVNGALAAMQLRSVPPPVALPTTRFSLAWHERFHRDPAHRWAREQVYEAVRSSFV